MRTTTTKAWAVGLALGIGLLAAGCGSDEKATDEPTTAADPVDAYCDVLQANQADIASFASGSPDFARFGELVTKVQAVADAATETVAADWKVLADGVAELQAALEAAGTDLAAVVGSIATGALPDGVTAQQMNGIGALLTALQGEDVKAATESIAANGKADCDVELVTIP